MSRKDVFANLRPQNLDEIEVHAPKPHTRPLLDVARAKPMAAVSKSLGDLNERSRRADEIEKRLAEGQAVIDLDPASIEPSFVQDRMPGEIEGLLASIREQGQQVPILVRPKPDEPGRYQVAFGHRRLRAVIELGLPVKAIVRELTDEQLVIAQGQENNERQDLSFIEKARFAARLKERFTRDVIISSMSVDKADLSKMLSIIDALPADLIEAIGSAPGVGRRSWEDLVDLLDKNASPSDALEFARTKEMQALVSEERFKALIAHFKPRRVIRGLPDVLATPTGERLAQIKQSKSKLEIMIDRKQAPDFAAFVLERLPALYEEHRANDQRKHGE